MNDERQSGDFIGENDTSGVECVAEGVRVFWAFLRLGTDADDDPWAVGQWNNMTNTLRSDSLELGPRNVSCSNPRFNTSDWITYSIPIAVIIIIFFSFLQPRKKILLGCNKGRPGTVYPVNVLDTYTDRISFALAFSVCCVNILDLFFGRLYFDVDTSHLPSMVQGAVAILLGIVNVILVGLVHFPLFLCLTVRKRLYGNMVGLLYSCFWSLLYISRLADCVSSRLTVENLLQNIIVLPIYICYMYLNIRFFIGICYFFGICGRLFKRCFVKQEKQEIREYDELFERTHYYRRMTYLFQSPSKWKSSHPPPSCFMRILRKLYPDHPGFKYSRRIVCTLILSLVCLYEFCVVYTIVFQGVLTPIKDAYFLPADDPLYIALDVVNATYFYTYTRELVVVVTDTLLPTALISLAVMMFFNLHAFVVYRNNTIKLWKGDRSGFPVGSFSCSTMVVANLRYSGYQIAFCLWGFIVIHLVLWLVVIVGWYFIISPLVYNWRKDNIILQLINDYWLGLVVTYAIYYSQVLCSRLFFLQKFGNVLGINNRRTYHITVYFTVFLNVLVGLASCLLRILKGMLFGVLLVGRIDYCLMIPGLELFDTGFKAYVGFLQLEVIHTHPVMVTFCHFLWKSVRKQEEAYRPLGDEDDALTRKRKAVARNKWHLAYTLIRNPVLLVDRLSHLTSLEREQVKLLKESKRNGTKMDFSIEIEDGLHPSSKEEDQTQTADISEIQSTSLQVAREFQNHVALDNTVHRGIENEGYIEDNITASTPVKREDIVYHTDVLRGSVDDTHCIVSGNHSDFNHFDVHNSSFSTVDAKRTFDDLINSSIDPEQLEYCKSNGIDVSSFVEDEMWKVLLNEGRTSLKRGKVADGRDIQDVEEGQNVEYEVEEDGGRVDNWGEGFHGAASDENTMDADRGPFMNGVNEVDARKKETQMGQQVEREDGRENDASEDVCDAQRFPAPSQELQFFEEAEANDQDSVAMSLPNGNTLGEEAMGTCMVADVELENEKVVYTRGRCLDDSTGLKLPKGLENEEREQKKRKNVTFQEDEMKLEYPASEQTGGMKDEVVIGTSDIWFNEINLKTTSREDDIMHEIANSRDDVEVNMGV